MNKRSMKGLSRTWDGVAAEVDAVGRRRRREGEAKDAGVELVDVSGGATCSVARAVTRRRDHGTPPGGPA